MALSSRPRRRPLSRIAIAVFFFFCVLLAWVAGLFAFAASIPDRVEDVDTVTDAVVVLTGGSGRLEEGLTLVAARKAKKLFVSGVYQGVDVQQLLELSRHRPEELSCCIVLGYAAGSTLGNAVETAAWLETQGYTSIRLVTANYHMPRSLVEFRHTMPGVRIVPHAVFPTQFKRDDWWRWPGSAQLVVIEYLKYLAAVARQSAEFVIE